MKGDIGKVDTIGHFKTAIMNQILQLAQDDDNIAYFAPVERYKLLVTVGGRPG